MKWKIKTPPRLKETRKRKKFLFLPRTFKGERRWLEFAIIEEEYYTYHKYTIVESIEVKGWVEVGFAK